MQLIPALRKRNIHLRDVMLADDRPSYVIAEIGINHNGSLDLALKMIDGAVAAGCQCVKFQKRTPELCVPPEQRAVMRDTPWGRMSYRDYRSKAAFSLHQYQKIDRYSRAAAIAGTASCWDEEAITFIDRFEVPFLKAASASLTDLTLLRQMRATGRPIMISTGMSTLLEIRAAVRSLGFHPILIAHSTSAYPCPPEEL